MTDVTKPSPLSSKHDRSRPCPTQKGKQENNNQNGKKERKKQNKKKTERDITTTQKP
jgi:hypothetical protein